MMLVAGISPKPNQSIPEELLDFGAYIQQTEIPDWIKYDFALKIYERQKPPRGFLATLYLESAHACRREVCGEIVVPGLNNDLQVALGKSIRKMNGFLRAQCLGIRRKQGFPILDPMKMETDPKILAEAAAQLIRIGEDNYVTDSNTTAMRSDGLYFTTGDMYVLNIRYAGILERLGRMEDADKSLRHGDSFIPDKFVMPEAEGKPEIKDYFARQLKLLHGVVDDRIACLKREEGIPV